VEVKRGRKGGATTPAPVPAPTPARAAKTAASAAEQVFQEREPSLADAQQPPRRILDAIEPEPVAEIVEPVATAEAPRRRGRPPLARPLAPRPSPARAASSRAENSAEAPVAPRVRREKRRVVKAAAAPVVVAPPPVVRIAPPPRAAVADRRECSEALPRGERWKRRLPKVLW
jgi:hypothetical protein